MDTIQGEFIVAKFGQDSPEPRSTTGILHNHNQL